jgi:hypothetical protein
VKQIVPELAYIGGDGVGAGQFFANAWFLKVLDGKFEG